MKKIKQDYNISKAKSVVLGMLAGLFTLAASCEHEDPMPQPQPGPEPTPVVPTKEITLDWGWFDKPFNLDTIKKYTDMADVKFVFLNLVDEEPASAVFPTSAFHQARDSLQPRFDISDKVRGSGIIYVSRTGGAQFQDGELATGMCIGDSAWFAEKGYQIKRFGNTKNGKTR